MGPLKLAKNWSRTPSLAVAPRLLGEKIVAWVEFDHWSGSRTVCRTLASG